MRIAQIVLESASAYERKSQRADHAALADRHEVIVVPIDAINDAHADVAHVYASGALPSAAFVRFPIPYIASADLAKRRWTWRRPVEPRFVVSPLAGEPLPEAVEDRYFADPSSAFGTFSPRRGEKATEGRTPGSLLPSTRGEGARRADEGSTKIIGSFDRPSVRNSTEQTLARIHRFRDDVEWQIFREPPAPDSLASVDVWVDPAVEPDDFDGFVAEALVVGLPVVATRTPINVLRLEQGRTGLLAPPRDPNEMTHAILAALFKKEVAESRQFAARQTVSKFRSRQRVRILTRLYETIR
ncbi:MAG TPA: glycosyltransferase family 4 protein [Thermoanaerobaculia bacterium]|nr:glycosyltransferase family 4 protein [Thermoanaerobaculia bacterium]